MTENVWDVQRYVQRYGAVADEELGTWEDAENYLAVNLGAIGNRTLENDRYNGFADQIVKVQS